MPKLGLVAMAGLIAFSNVIGVAAGSNEDGITIPYPRAGQVHVVGPHTWAWGDEILELEDAWGVRREVVALDLSHLPPAFVSLHHAVSVATVVQTDNQNSRDISHFRDRRATDVEGLAYVRHGHITLGLMGKTIAPGDIVSTTPGHEWNGRYVAVGWEDVEGKRLFRVEVEHELWGVTSRHTFWYDGEHPVPSRGLWFGQYLRLLTSVGGDPDAPRLAPKNPAQPFPAVHVDATWVPLTRDGPAEPMRAGFTLQEAVAAFRATFATWMEANPEAYLVKATYDVEDPVFAREFMEPTRTGHDTVFSWSLVYAVGHEGRSALIHKAAAPGALPFVVWKGTASYGLPMRPFSYYEGKMVACAEHADRAALAAAEGREADVRTGTFELTPYRHVCSVNHATKEGDVSYAPTPSGIADTWHVHGASVHPLSGRVEWRSAGTGSSEYRFVTEEDGQNSNPCDDLRDNDGDGRIDIVDGGCWESGSESPDPECWDGYNNDGDIYPDWPLDPDCESLWDPDESS
ncbi:MAG TPA: hypothetical protein VM889_12080 [Candidatus Thermoplasmatota archaeon]|nr:hypothetical protein [Candidatus Thermoplasmatota archaeon]